MPICMLETQHAASLTMCSAYDKYSNDILDLSRGCPLVFWPEETMVKAGVVKHGDVSARVGVEVIRARGVDVEKLIKMLIANAAAEFASTYYYYTILRSEEHTSELQSPCNLVCRLLL